MDSSVVYLLTFHRAGDNAFNDVFLQEDKHDDRRQHGHYHGDHGILPIGCVLTEEGVGGKRQRFCIGRAVNHEQRKQEVIPYPHHVNDDDRRRNRLSQREDDEKEQLEAGSAVNRRARINFLGNTINKAVIDKYGERCAEAPIENA